MARKRKSNEMPDPQPGASRASHQKPQVTSSDRSSKELAADYEKLLKEADIELDSDPLASPYQISVKNIKAELFECYRFLWWKHKPGLRKAEADFFADLSANKVQSNLNFQKIDHLLEKLKHTALEHQAAFTPRTRRTLEPILQRSQPSRAPSSPSPTSAAYDKGIGIAGHFAVSKSSLRSETSKPIPSPALFAKPALPRANPQDSFTAKSTNISFVSNASKSFNSFWSNPGPPASSQDTDITESSQEPDQPMSKRSSEYSSLTPSVTMEMTNMVDKLQPSHNSDSTNQTVRSRIWPSAIASCGQTTSRSGRESQSTNYGSPIDPKDADLLQMNADALGSHGVLLPGISSHFSRTISVGTSELDNVYSERSGVHLSRVTGASSRSEAVMTDGVSELAGPGGSQDDHIGDTKRRAVRQSDESHLDASKASVAEPGLVAEEATTRNMRFKPAEAFAQLQIPASFDNLPFSLQWEAQRLLQTGKISRDQLANQWAPRTLNALYDMIQELQVPFFPSFDVHKEISPSEVTFGGKLQYAMSNSGPIFDLKLRPPRQEKSCDLQRRYGADHVLYIDMPCLNKPTDAQQGRKISVRFREMATRPQHFLGRKWILYVLQPNKHNKKSANPDSVKAGSHRLIFLAIENTSIRDVFHYLLPYYSNAKQHARKLYTRLDLSISRTTPTVQFEVGDIDYRAKDQTATRDEDDTSFRDPSLHDDSIGRFDPDREMGDGCAEMSSWAFWKVVEALGGTVKSAYQCRIGGAKGVWYRAPEDHSSFEAKSAGHHIKLVESQVKVKRDSLQGCDPQCRILNVVKPNSHARPSVLHTGFLPILIDRGVPRAAIVQVVRTQVEAEVAEFERALREPGTEPLRRWMSIQNGVFEERNRLKGIQTLASFPARREERIVQMLESGFEPRSCPPLAREVKLMAQQVFEMRRHTFKIRLSRSTTLMGISDPYGCLRPGEICINFSAPFKDTNSGMTWMRLNRMEVLIARNPAMAPWDIQKVRCVSRPELEHLTDLVILSSIGRRSLASLLQGGDYDGDIYWICFEQKLVQSFRNAPAPWEPPAPERFHIVKQKELLNDYVMDPTSESQWCRWLGEMAIARMDFNLLGVVTRVHERMVYATGDLRSKGALALVHLHDYLVDADKQGYSFNFAAFDEFKKSMKIPGNLPDPAYWEFTKHEDRSRESEGTSYAVKKVVPRVIGNIIDDVYLQVVEPTINASLKRVDDILTIENAECPDKDLTAIFEQIFASAQGEATLRDELQHLETALQEIRKVWAQKSTFLPWDDLITKLRGIYDAIQPENPSHLSVIEWLRRVGNDMTTWEKLKASALVKFQHRAHNYPGRMVFSIAGNELCRIKAHALGPTRVQTLEQYQLLKLRKVKKVEFPDEYDEEMNGDEDFDEEAAEPEEILHNTGYY